MVANKPQPVLCTVRLFFRDRSVAKIWQNSRCYNIGSLWYIWNKMTIATLRTMMPKVIETLSHKNGSRILPAFYSIHYPATLSSFYTFSASPQGLNYHSLSLIHFHFFNFTFSTYTFHFHFSLSRFHFYTFFASPQGVNYDWKVKVTDLLY